MVTRLTSYTKQRYVTNFGEDPGDIVFRNGDTVFLMDTQQEIIYSEENNQWYQVPSVAGGGDPYSIARSILDGSITEYIDPELTELRHSAFRNATKLVTLQVHGVAKVGTGCIENTKITALALPSLNTAINGLNSAYGSCGTLHYLDYGPLVHNVGSNSMQFPYLQVLILRKADGLVGGVSSSFNTTPMKQGGAGVTVYIPKALYDHLGDGTALDYKAATNWSTYDAYGTITWAQIEGSIYETQYADGTAIS